MVPIPCPPVRSAVSLTATCEASISTTHSMTTQQTAEQITDQTTNQKLRKQIRHFHSQTKHFSLSPAFPHRTHGLSLLIDRVTLPSAAAGWLAASKYSRNPRNPLTSIAHRVVRSNSLGPRMAGAKNRRKMKPETTE